MLQSSNKEVVIHTSLYLSSFQLLNAPLVPWLYHRSAGMSRGFDEDEKCIFVGGLRRDLAAGKLKSHIKYLFKCINISVKKSNILIINNPKSDYCYGFVNLEDVDTVKYVLHHLSTQANRDNLRFDFSTIQDQNKRLKFDCKKPPKQPPPDSVNTSNNMNYGEHDSSWASAKKIPFNSPSHQNNHGNSIQTSTTGLPVITLSKPELPLLQNTQKAQISMATSVSGLAPGLPERYYSLKEHLGNETRTVEFKEGGFVTNDRKYVLQENVGKYVCAFLNTDGGTLLVGVNNDGQVVGVTCDQQEEDKHRLSIDQAIKMISPSVLPALYTVQFVPVLDKNNSFASNLKVLEVKVKATDDHGDLYVYRGDAFIRRDGSVQMLKARDIQEWERKRLEPSQEGKEEVLHKLVEKTEQLQLLQQHVAKLERKQDNKQDNERKKKKKSKVCSVM